MTGRPRALEIAERDYKTFLELMGNDEAVLRFLNRFGNIGTRRSYAWQLYKYFGFLKRKGIAMSPSELLSDNLVCVYRSQDVDVATKRKHREWLAEFCNVVMLSEGIADTTRIGIASTVSNFYESNDSPLFGKVVVSRRPAVEGAPALTAQDIRTVLKSLSLSVRAPLVMSWQSGMEINRVLSLRWGDLARLDRGEYPLRLSFPGRKKHRRAYGTYLGHDSITILREWRSKWSVLQKRQPQAGDLVFMRGTGRGFDSRSLTTEFRRTALRLHGEGLIQNGNPNSWHSHALRHSFKTECNHAGIEDSTSEAWMGHLGGIEATYNHQREIHPEDLVKEYAKVEPFVSLDYTESTLREEFEEERKSWLTELVSLKEEIRRLGLQPQGPRASSSASPSPSV